MNTGCRCVAWFATVKNHNGAASATEGKSGAEPGRTATNDECVVSSFREISHAPMLRSTEKNCQDFLLEWQTGIMSETTEDILTAVGPRLRALRLRRNVTLADLSDTTGISVSTLSRLESGQRRPNLELLLPLAREHGVPLDELVGAPPTGDPRIHLRPIKRFGMTILPLSSEAGGLRAFKNIIPASSPRKDPTPRTHEGYEWIYVLKGQLRLVLGEHDLILPAGEAAEFSTQTPHWFGRAGDEAVEFLSLFGKSGERMHVRASPKQPESSA